MATSYIGLDGTIRWYDSTASTPYYLEAVYEQMDFSGPLGRARPEEILVLDRGVHTSNSHYVRGNDEPILEPLDISFSCRLDDTTLRQKLRDVLDCDHDGVGSSWDVGGNTFVTTKGDSSLISGTGSSVAAPAFADTVKNTTDLELLWDAGSNDIGLRYGEVYWPPEQQQINEAEDSVMVNLTGRCYGLITEITSLTAGSAS